MTDLVLTPAEREQIMRQRQAAERARFCVEGAFATADHLHSLGQQCAGGDGESINPDTKQPWGWMWFEAERSVRHWAATWKPNV